MVVGRRKDRPGSVREFSCCSSVAAAAAACVRLTRTVGAVLLLLWRWEESLLSDQLLAERLIQMVVKSARSSKV